MTAIHVWCPVPDFPSRAVELHADGVDDLEEGVDGDPAFALSYRLCALLDDAAMLAASAADLLAAVVLRASPVIVVEDAASLDVAVALGSGDVADMLALGTDDALCPAGAELCDALEPGLHLSMADVLRDALPEGVVDGF